jgi:citrate lyase subunit beta/citryl-CoA lyase
VEVVIVEESAASMIRGALAFVPGRASLLAKAAEKCTPTAFVADLEDSIAPGDKVAARDAVAEFLATSAVPRSPGAVPWFVRVNSLQSGLFRDDVAAVVRAELAPVRVLSVGKVSTADELREIERLVADAESRAQLAAGSVRLLPWLETARGVAEAGAICGAARRVAGVAFGMDDFLADVGLSLDDAADRDLATLHARQCVSLAAAAFALPAFESPFVNFRDDAGLRAYARRAKLLGFVGQFAIHPAQVAAIEAVFAPSAAELARAHTIVEQYEAAERAQRGSTKTADGMMIDRPVYLRAKRLLSQAR